MTAAPILARPFAPAGSGLFGAPDLPATRGAGAGLQPVFATLSETSDAAATVATGYTMGVADTFLGSIGHDGDLDMVRVRLEQGHRYTFDVQGIGLSDTVLAVFDRAGNEMGFNDDFGTWDHSQVTISTGAAGDYFLRVGGYGSATGSYRLTATDNGAPTNTQPVQMQQIAHQLTDGFWNSLGGGRRAFDVAPGGTLSVDMSQLNAEGQQLARMALNAWSQVTGIRFDNTSRAGSGADIFMDDAEEAGAYSQHQRITGNTVEHAIVNIPLSWHRASPGEGYASYEYQTYLHELGHALGLGHAGNYNGAGTYGIDNDYGNDSWQATVMSYFSQTENTVVNASYAFAVTPMIADILAMQDLYGTPAGQQGGNTVWGANGNVGGALGQAMALITRGEDLTMTIFDQGGNDRLNLGNDTRAQVINLQPGTTSSIYGLTGNLSIAQGSVIETLYCGRGNDRATGNAADNYLWGNAGNDTLLGAAGDNSLEGGTGADSLVGGAGNDLYIIDALDTIVELADGGIDRVRSWVNHALGDNLEALLLAWKTDARFATGNSAANTVVGSLHDNYLSGAAGNDTLFGMDGNDTLAGNAGRDRLVGGAGDDLYLLDRFDTVVEAAAGGIDTVQAAFDLTLADNVECATITGNNAVTVIGNALDNVITGNGAANTIVSGGGSDVLWGGGGSDVFVFATGQGGRIADFQDDIDTLRLDVDLSTGLTVADILAIGANTATGCQLVLDDAVLRIDDVTLAGLRDDLVLI